MPGAGAVHHIKTCREQVQQIAALFDHLVGTAEQRERDSEAERFGRRLIDDQLEFRRAVKIQAGNDLAAGEFICRGGSGGAPLQPNSIDINGIANIRANDRVIRDHAKPEPASEVIWVLVAFVAMQISQCWCGPDRVRQFTAKALGRGRSARWNSEEGDKS